MQSERWKNCTDIFNAAIEGPHNARTALLERTCNGDEALRRKVELLLKYHDESGDFIASPAFVSAPELLVDDPHALIGQHLGCYRVDAVLGAGGMGVVYLAYDERLGRKVGLKVLPPSLLAKEGCFERVKREARTASALNHPNIMTIHEVGEVDSTHYITTEFIEGATLRNRMSKNPIPPNEALDIATQIATALCVAHAAGIVHRDIKPENIMLRPDGYVKVLDFGIAKFTQHETLAARTSMGVQGARQQGMILGTTRYMSPEQARGRIVDARSDLWSLGVVLYEMLAGHPPFEGATPTDVIAAVLLKEPKAVEQRATIAPPALQNVVERSLRKNPAERYQSAEEMLAHLRSLEEKTDNSPRRKARWIGVAAVAALLVSLGVYYGWRERHVAPASGPAAIEKSIAVLPFENLSKDEENAFFTDGVQDEILTKLAKIGDLKVISRASVMQYKNAAPRNLREIAQQLGVYHVLEGSVERAAQRVRVNVRLVDARNHAQLWAQTYDRDLADVFAIQSEIAASIAEQLQTHLSAREKAAIAQAPTHDLAANNLYLRAKGLWASAEADPGGKQNMLKAVRLLEEAVTHDPGFVLAYCMLCTIHLDIYWTGIDHTPARRDLGDTALRNATRLQPDAGEVHAARANYAYHGFRDYDRARAEMELARRSLPNNADVYLSIAAIDRRQARWNEAIRNFERAIELDPRNFSIVVEEAFLHSGLRRFSDSRQLLERALSILPGDHFVRSELVRLNFLERGELDSWRDQLSAIEKEGSAAASRMAFQLVWCALAARDREAAAHALTFIPPEGVVDGRSNALYPREWFVGLVAQIFGDKAGAQTAFTEARPILERMTIDQPEYAAAWSLLGMIDAALGRKENAIREGRHACELLPVSKDSWEGSSWVTNLATIYAWIGENDAALQQLESSAGNFGVTYGELKLFPIWDSLRSDPRFDQIVASLAPKDEEAVAAATGTLIEPARPLSPCRKSPTEAVFLRRIAVGSPRLASLRHSP
ncbi:MAG: FlgO family outer membrane protein [Opitutaceae bacterium]